MLHHCKLGKLGLGAACLVAPRRNSLRQRSKKPGSWLPPPSNHCTHCEVAVGSSWLCADPCIPPPPGRPRQRMHAHSNSVPLLGIRLRRWSNWRLEGSSTSHLVGVGPGHPRRRRISQTLVRIGSRLPELQRSQRSAGGYLEWRGKERWPEPQHAAAMLSLEACPAWRSPEEQLGLRMAEQSSRRRASAGSGIALHQRYVPLSSCWTNSCVPGSRRYVLQAIAPASSSCLGSVSSASPRTC